MKTTLNNYTIDDFLKIKPVIYEYCCNLVKRGIGTSWYNDQQKARDLYQEVFIYVKIRYFHKQRDPITEDRFIQYMKNCTYWAYQNQFLTKDYKTHGFINHYEDSTTSNFLFESNHFENPKLFKNLEEHPDYSFYTSNLTKLEKEALLKFTEGYTKTEVANLFNRSYNLIPNIIDKIKRVYEKENLVKTKYHKKLKIQTTEITDDVSFLKSKIENYELVFDTDKFVKLYSMYLQGFSNKLIAKNLNKSVSQVNVELYRLRQKIKKYERTI